MKPYYERDGITIWNCDCREVLPTLSGIDAVVTDPPYGYGYETNYTAPTTTAKWMNRQIDGDDTTDARDEVIRWAADRAWLAFGSWKRPAPIGTRGVLVWDKCPASGMGDLSFPWKGSWEQIYVGGRGWSGERDEGVIKGHWIVTRASMGRVHPNEKPVSLMEVLIGKLPSHYTILDPFGGSMTTGVAAWNLGRKCVLCEISEEYCELGAKRLDRVISQGRLFRPEPIKETQRSMFGDDP